MVLPSKFYAKPLTYTPSGSSNQLVFLASSQNWIRTLDAKTGALVNARQVHTPFLQSDLNCGGRWASLEDVEYVKAWLI